MVKTRSLRFHKLGTILDHELKEEGFQEIAQLKTLQDHWVLVMGEGLWLKTFAHHLNKNQLTIWVEDIAYSLSLQAKKENLLRLINSLLREEKAVRNLHFQVGDYHFFQNRQQDKAFGQEPPKKDLTTQTAKIPPGLEVQALSIRSAKLRRNFLRWAASISNQVAAAARQKKQ